MKALVGVLAGMGLIGALLIFGLAFGSIALTIYGMYLAFSASIILGIVVFLVEPSPFVIGAVMFFFHTNLAEAIMTFLNN